MQLRKGLVVIASLLFSVTLGAGWAQTNLITNGSFESPVVPDGNYGLVSNGQTLFRGGVWWAQAGTWP